MQRRLCGITLCFGLASASVIIAATARAAEPPTLDEIKSRLAKEWSQLQSLYIEVTGEYKLTVDPKLYLTLPGHEENVILMKEESHYAFKGEKRYQRSLCPAVVKSPWPLKPPEVDKASPAAQAWQKRPEPRDEYHLMPDHALVCNGKLQWERRVPGNGQPSTLFIMGADNSGHWGQPPYYLTSIGWSIPDPTERDKQMVHLQRMSSLPDLFAAQPYVVAKAIAVADGAHCAVLHANRKVKFNAVGGGVETRAVDDTIWLDLDHGLAMKQRDWVAGQDHITRTVCGDFVEILRGLWFPRSVALQHLVPPSGPEQYRGKPMRVCNMKLTKWIANQVPDDLFDVVPRPARDEQVFDMRLPEALR
jgi:hypothetical protein